MSRVLFTFVILATLASAAHAETRVVGQKGKVFAPKAVHIKVGDALVFKNDDDVTHHMYSSTKGHEFNLRITKPGGEAQHTFTKPGTVQVQCGLHPGMRLAVTVK